MNLRPTFAKIDLAALKHNYNQVLRRVPHQCQVLAMVKADAYGHGAVPVAKTLAECGVAALGVATVEEGVELREAGIQAEVLVLQGLLGMGEAAAKVLVEHKLTPVIHSISTLSLWETLCDYQQLPIHLKVDTGMTRLGITPQALPSFLDAFKKCSHLKLEGVMTHLAWRENALYTKRQIQLFKEMGEAIQKCLGEVPIWHLANSASVIDGSPIEFSWPGKYWVRPGIMLYGIPPYPSYQNKVDLKPVLSLLSQVALIKSVPKGTKVSYNCTYTTKRPTRLGVVPIGYADGYPWSASGKSQVLVEGRRVPVLGRVTMDMIMIDLTDVSASKVGSEAVLLGSRGKETITADQLAKWAGNIAYEIVTRISKRIPRVYS